VIWVQSGTATYYAEISCDIQEALIRCVHTRSGDQSNRLWQTQSALQCTPLISCLRQSYDCVCSVELVRRQAKRRAEKLLRTELELAEGND